MSHNVIHISEAKLIKPESQSLILYALQNFNIKYEDLLVEETDFQLKNLPAVTVKYRTCFSSPERKSYLELSILQAKTDEDKDNCSALLIRELEDEKVKNIFMFHFYVRPYARDTVFELLQSEPAIISAPSSQGQTPPTPKPNVLH